MTQKRLFWLYLLIVISVLGVAVYFRSFLFPNLIMPTAQFFWAIFRIFASVSQSVYWTVLIGMIILLAYRIIFSIPKEIRNKYATESDKPIGREQFWLEAISNAIENGEDSRELLHQQLGQLFLAASNLSALSKNGGAVKALLNIQPPLPANLLSLFQENGYDEKHFRSVSFAFAGRMFQGTWWSRRRIAKATYKDIEAILQSMEEYLEIDYEP